MFRMERPPCDLFLNEWTFVIRKTPLMLCANTSTSVSLENKNWGDIFPLSPVLLDNSSFLISQGPIGDSSQCWESRVNSRWGNPSPANHWLCLTFLACWWLAGGLTNEFLARDFFAGQPSGAELLIKFPKLPVHLELRITDPLATSLSEAQNLEFPFLSSRQRWKLYLEWL